MGSGLAGSGTFDDIVSDAIDVHGNIPLDRSISPPVEEIGSIQEWAAADAAKVLIDCWEDAIKDGRRAIDLIKDIDEVCDILTAWKPRVLIDMKKMERG